MDSFISRTSTKLVLITGGSKGLGLNTSRQLAEKGVNVVIVVRSVSNLQEGIAYISKGARRPDIQRFHYINANVAVASECDRVVAEAIEWGGSPPDIV
ncbi:hypothetical protein HD806DRAFT_542043 [Xylariaceae sp. AK1471]|nr:hypothetical protein HD806DRAFT_542043 [Xylariaceae sp. AK1471]